MKYPEWNGHGLLGRLAFDGLPTWEQELIQPDVSEAGLDYPYFPDHVKSAADKTGQLAKIMDLVYYDECRPYATLPDGRWIPHSPPDAQWQSCSGSGQPRSLQVSVELLELLLERMIKPIREGDWEEAVHYGGALAHHVQEPFTPGHAMDNSVFHEFFPDPDPQRHMRLHHAFDNASGNFEPLPATLLGTSVREAAYRLFLQIDHGIRQGKKVIWPVVRSVYEGFPTSLRQELLADQSRLAVYATSCAWHTAICIALDRFDEAEVATLQELPLLQLEPYFFHAWQYVEVTPGSLVKDKRKIPIQVTEKTPAGEREIRVEDGFGMGGYMGIKYFVDGDLYPIFRCRVGLPCRHTEGQQEGQVTRFYVEMDREVNTVYSEEIEYQAETLQEVELTPGKPLTEVEVDLSGARSLILRAKTDPQKDPETGAVTFSIPHVAICEPSLRRR